MLLIFSVRINKQKYASFDDLKTAYWDDICHKSDLLNGIKTKCF